MSLYERSQVVFSPGFFFFYCVLVRWHMLLIIKRSGLRTGAQEGHKGGKHLDEKG